MNTSEAKRVLETALLCAHEALTVNDLRKLFSVAEGEEPTLEADAIKEILAELQQDWSERGIELVLLSTGWRFQSRSEMKIFLDRLNPEKPPKYTVRHSRRWPSSRTGNPLHVVILKKFVELQSTRRPSSYWKIVVGLTRLVTAMCRGGPSCWPPLNNFWMILVFPRSKICRLCSKWVRSSCPEVWKMQRN